MREDFGAVVDLDDVVDDPPDRVAHRREGAADVQQPVSELRDPGAGALRGLRLDQVLELVDLLVDLVDQVQILLCDLVDDPVGDHPGLVRLLDRPPDRPDVEWRAVARRLAHGQDRLVGDHEVDLGIEDLAALLDVLGTEEDPEDVAAVAPERRTRLVLVDGRAQQQLEGALLERPRRLLPQLLFTGVDQVDPDRSHGRRGYPRDRLDVALPLARR